MLVAFLTVFFFYPETKGVSSDLCVTLSTTAADTIFQITLEEVEVVFGSGAGVFVRQALGRRASVADPNDSDGPIEGNAVTLNAVPQFTRKGLHLSNTKDAQTLDDLPPYSEDPVIK